MGKRMIMPKSIPEKLLIKPGQTLFTLHAPDDFRRKLHKLPAGVKIVTSGKDYDQVHWFVSSRAQLEKELSRVMMLVKENVVVWVYYPKKSSGVKTDLSRDEGWDCFLKEDDKLRWINLISFDETWSVFGFRGRNEADRQKDVKPTATREIFNWVNPTTKEVRLPADLEALLKKNKNTRSFFDSLSFTNKKEYIEWIVTAKRDDTRLERLSGTIERLVKKWKNPRNS